MTPSVIAVTSHLEKMNLSSNASLFCSVCQVHVSSELVMEVHVKGKRHSQLEQRQKDQAAFVAQSVYVRGFPPTSTADQLTEFFQQFGTVDKVVLDREYGHYAIVVFNEDSVAKSVLSQPSVFMNFSRLTIRPRQMKGVQPKRKARRVPACPLQKQSSALSSATMPSTAIDFESIKEKLKDCRNLEEEMDLLLNEMSLSPDEIVIRQNIRNELEAVLQQNFSADCQVVLFGSSVNGLGTKGCDLDLFLDLRSEESSSHFSTSSKTNSDSAVPPNDKSSTCDDSVTCENDDSTTCENDDSITCDKDTSTDDAVSRNEEESHQTLVVQSSKSLQESIKKISNLIRARRDVYAQVVRVISARCPVVKFVHLSTSLKCDLSINNRLALHNTSLIQFLLSVDSRIRPLVFSIRQWARVRGVAGQLNAGPKLTNYALTMIVFFYLQVRLPPILPSLDRLSHLAENPCVIDGWDCSFTSDSTKLQPEAYINPCSNSEEEKSEERESLEELLCGFFEFYAKLDLSLKVICLRTGTSIDLNSFSEQVTSDPRLKDFKISPLLVQDPFVLNHNIASNVNDKSLLILQTELKAAAVKCRAQLTSTAACPRPSLIPLFSSEPSIFLTHPPAQHLNKTPPTTSECQGKRAAARSFTVKADASKLMAEALRRKKTFAEMQEKWCNNSVMIVRQTLKIFDIQSCLVKQQGQQVECTTTEDTTVSCHGGALEGNSNEVDDRIIQSEKTVSDLANNKSACDTHDDESCLHDGIEICLKEANNCRKRYFSKDDDGKEPKRSKNCSERNDSTENDDSIAQEDSSKEKSSVDDFHEPSNSEQKGHEEQNQEKNGERTYPVFSADCSTRSKLWIDRKKLRKQLSHLELGDYEKEVQVSQRLSSQLKPSEQEDMLQEAKGEEELLKFKISLLTENSLSTALVVSMEMEVDQKTKEFSCFFFSFRSVVEKLVDVYGTEDIEEWRKDE